MKGLDYTALTLVIIGAINWGLIGLFRLDLVSLLFGNMTWLSRVVYTLVGILGYGMRRFQFPAGPMIIGFILGPLLESAFDQTMTLSDGSFMIFLTHPFSVVLLLLTVAAVFSIARARLRRSKIAQLAQEG